MWYKQIKSIEKFIEGVSGKALIVHHNDVDGVCSAYLTREWLEERFEEVEAVSSLPGKPFLVPRLYKRVVRKNPDIVFFVDMAVDQDPEPIESLSKKKKVVIIDHHLVNKDMNSDRIIHINHHLEGFKKYTPASKMCYDLFKGKDWVAAVGVIADSGAKQWYKFIRNVNQKYGTSGSDFESSLGIIGNIINSLRIKGVKKWNHLALKVLDDADGPFDVIDKKTSSAKKAWGIYEKTNRKIRKIVNGFPKKADVHGSVAFYPVKKGFYGGTVATIIAKENPHMTIIMVQKEPSSDTLFLNLRRADKEVDVSELVQEATRGLEQASGGGHVAAAGGTLKKKDYQKFKTRVLSILDE